MLAIIRQALLHQDRIAVLSGRHQHTYRDLLQSSGNIARTLLNRQEDLKEARIAFMITPGVDYVSTLWGIWQAGGIAVPLCLSHPAPAIDYVLRDTGCTKVMASRDYASLLTPLCANHGIELIFIESVEIGPNVVMPDVDPNRRAMILYTSGTTNLPKGVVTTHRNLEAQIAALIRAWRWTSSDHTLCILPLHHVHGIVNVVSCSLWAGAQCEFLPDFDADKVFEVFLRGQVNVFMAVPTIYFKLITAWEHASTSEQQRISAALKSMRLMVSGSAALPVSVMERWEKISGHRLLERYGMTELGMAISNPYDGERRPGHVGMPLDGVEIRLCNEKDQPVEDEPGEIQVRGANVFLEYWRQTEATQRTFAKDGWFKTGDVAVLEDGYYRILGRSSVDIIKSGGYKISALEIEEILRTHPEIKDCAVVGLDDEEWGEVVAAAIIPIEKQLNTKELQSWMKERIPGYRVPRKFLQLKDLPRNAMGKVTKNDVKKLF
jgi:malonyl-CoA/methylmalonyl-CoA synthetase